MSLWARCEQCGQYQPDPEGNGSAGLHRCPGAGRPHISDAEHPAAVFERFVSATQGPPLSEAEQQAVDALTARHLARVAHEQVHGDEHLVRGSCSACKRPAERDGADGAWWHVGSSCFGLGGLGWPPKTEFVPEERAQ